MLVNDCTHLFQPKCWGCYNSYVYYMSVWLPLLHPQRVYLQSTEGNWKADGISLVSQAEVRVWVWLRGLPLSGRGRCKAHHLPARPPVSHSPHCSLIWCTHRVNKHASLRHSQTPNYPIPQVSLPPPCALSHTQRRHFTALECLFSQTRIRLLLHESARPYEAAWIQHTHIFSTVSFDPLLR